jgi:hypothetical protein
MSERDSSKSSDDGLRPNWEERVRKDEDPCWDGYTMVGLKENGNPRCVPEEDVEDYDADKSEKIEQKVEPAEGLEDACWDGYVAVGMKEGENGEMVPDCVPADDKSARKRRVYVDHPSEVPDEYMHTVSTGRTSDVIYYEPEERGSGSSRSGSVVDDLAGAVRDLLEDDGDRLRDEVGLGEDPDREQMEEIAEELMEEQAELMRAKMSKFLAKEFELDEGLTWTEQVEVVDVDMQDEEVTMRDTLNESEWVETIEQIEEKLEMLADRDHEWLYQLVADDYANMQPQDVHETLHQAAGLETEQIEAEDESGRTVVVAEKADVPDQYTDTISEGDVSGTYEYTVSE